MGCGRFRAGCCVEAGNWSRDRLFAPNIVATALQEARHPTACALMTQEERGKSLAVCMARPAQVRRPREDSASRRVELAMSGTSMIGLSCAQASGNVRARLPLQLAVHG